MTIDGLKTQLKAAGIIGIHVENVPPDSDRDRLTFAGTLGEYLETLRTLAIASVIIYCAELHEGYFVHSPDSPPDDEDEGETETEAELDLCALNSDLKRFKTFIGRDGLFRLSASIQSEHLDVEVQESWWSEFLEARSRTLEDWEHGEDKRRTQHDEQEAERDAALIQKLHALVDDPKFAKLRTQKVMIHYALRNIGGLDELDEGDLKREIGDLKAKLDSQ